MYAHIFLTSIYILKTTQHAIIAIFKIAIASRKRVALQGWLMVTATARMLLLLQSTAKEDATR